MSDIKVPFTLSLEEVNTILAGLGELPYKMSFNLIESIRSKTLQEVDKINAKEKEKEES